MILHQHISARNHQIIEASIAIVFCIKALLRTNISSLHSRKSLECFWVTDGN